MCQRITVLARDNSGRVIAQCEHGTMHIFWRRATIFLHPTDLLPLLHFLEAWPPSSDSWSARGFQLNRLENGNLQLWCDVAGLQMSEGELYMLLGLLRQAAEELDLAGEMYHTRAEQVFAPDYRQITSVASYANANN